MNKGKKKIVLSAAAAVVFFAGFLGLIYFSFRLGALKQEKKVLLKDLTTIEKDLEILGLSLKDREKQLKDMQDKLDELSYPERLKQALTAAQGMINILNAELTNVKTQADILRGENFALKSRVAANTKELDRLVQDLNQARTKVATLESSQKMALQEESLIRLNDQIKEKDRLIRSLNRDIGQLKNKHSDIVKDRDFLKKNIERYQKELAGRKPSDIWQKRLEELAGLLKEKDREKNEILKKYTDLSRDKDDVAVDIDGYKRNIEELKAINQNLQDQVLKLVADLSRKSSDLYVLEKRMEEAPASFNDDELIELRESLRVQKERIKTVNSLYDRLRDQLRELSGILHRKDAALEEKDRQLFDLRDKMAYLKIKVDNLQGAFNNSEESQRQIVERLSQATSLNETLQERLSEVSTILNNDSSTVRTRSPEEGIGSSADPLDASGIRGSSDDLRRRVEVILESIESGD